MRITDINYGDGETWDEVITKLAHQRMAHEFREATIEARVEELRDEQRRKYGWSK